ncbi:type VII secretion protein EccB [Nocardioides jensenii]|uniref:type VII secretion protein EccB n=1 Tax=Nocardioides jensenii TaxID=1843 RepID=UPI00082FD543|nr:type VII secretion protein EccB [Nocardioides jensenii]
MSSKRDLVEAHAFSRRRLVSAFISGAPGGREVEPVRQSRVILAGLALAVLLLAGAALASILGGGRSPSDWLEPGVVISKEEGSRYVVLTDDGDLHPVLNPVSAKLLLGDTEPKVVKQELIREQPLGAQIGIYGAPDGVPDRDSLRPSGWTSCTTSQAASHLHIGDTTTAQPLTGAGMVVSVRLGKAKKDVFYLVAPSADAEHGYHRYLLGTSAQAAPLRGNLGLDGAREFRVSTQWLNLFPEAPALALSSFGLPADSPKVTYDVGGRDLRVGQLVRNPSSKQVYLLGEDQPLLLTEFSLRVYDAIAPRGQPTDVAGIAGEPLTALADWPRAAPTPLTADESCAVLETEKGEAARVLLASGPSDEESAVDVPPDSAEVSVEPPYGAYVNVGQFGDTTGGAPVLIDMNATRYRLGGETGLAARMFGYGSDDPPTVPDAWTEGFDCGPELSQEAARRAPDPRSVSQCDR